MNLDLQILKSLSQIPDHLMMPVATLWAEVRMFSMPQPDRPTFDAALRRLEDDLKQIIRITNTDADKAKITASGKARLAEALG